ncbi:DUF1156 domain-containing protein [Marinobacter sp. SS8-8]|uniref:DUF1156 domain-containing protein n=1 Tax=Marinobacter sp. SS8-8 TaxID=3050452 RepID=UPI0026E0ED6E|nr:DUF1156 domain-containing protein [Marinobacter sp. SS8-8]
MRHGHPGTLHFGWARRPLGGGAGGIVFQLVNVPGYQYDQPLSCEASRWVADYRPAFLSRLACCL